MRRSIPKLTTLATLYEHLGARRMDVATPGLDRRGAVAQIRAAYRWLAKRHHADLNPGPSGAVRRTQALHVTHEILSDPAQRLAWDHELDAPKRSAARPQTARIGSNLYKDVPRRIEDLLRGRFREMHVNDHANPDG